MSNHNETENWRYGSLAIPGIRISGFSVDEQKLIDKYAQENRNPSIVVGDVAHYDTSFLGINKETGEVVDYRDQWAERMQQTDWRPPEPRQTETAPNFMRGLPFQGAPKDVRYSGENPENSTQKPKKRWWKLWRS